jgi:hypothetical protein
VGFLVTGFLDASSSTSWKDLVEKQRGFEKTWYLSVEGRLEEPPL